MPVLIAVVATVVYLAGWLLTARNFYGRKRPFTEPLACDYPSSSLHEHYESCHRRPGTVIDSTSEALAFACLVSMVWPFYIAGIIGIACIRPLIADRRELPEDLAAKTRRLERELGMRDERR
jgi:hypothetical protein